MNLKLSSVPYISAFLQSSITIPNQWINDIKLVDGERSISIEPNGRIRMMGYEMSNTFRTPIGP